MLIILLLARKIADAPVEERPSLDVVGTILSASGLGALVFGVLRSSEWGWFLPKPDAPSWAGLSADHLADPRRPVRALALLALGGPPLVAAARSRSSARGSSGTSS